MRMRVLELISLTVNRVAYQTGTPLKLKRVNFLLILLDRPKFITLKIDW